MSTVYDPSSNGNNHFDPSTAPNNLYGFVGGSNSLSDVISGLSPVNWWKLDDNTDNAGSLTLTEVGSPTYITGVDGNAVSLDGSTQYLYNAVADYRGSDNSGSVSMFVKLDSAADFNFLFNTPDAAVSNKHILMGTNITTGTPFMYQRNADTPDQVDGTTNIVDGAWHHLVVTSSGSAWKIYVDGVEESLSASSGSNTGQWFNSVNGRDYVVIGAWVINTGAGFETDGSIDEVAVFDYALTAQNIADIYTASGL